MSGNEIPLLSGKAFAELSPPEFKEHVRSLYDKPTPKKTKTIKIKKPFVWSLTKKGKLSVRTTRKPKWLSREEVEQIVKESGLPANEVWLKILDKKSGFKISTLEDEKRIALEIDSIPF